MVGKQHFQLRGIGKGGTQCRLPRDFPIKSCSQIYFVNVEIHLLMCSPKLCFVPVLGDFCSCKNNFGGGKYNTGIGMSFLFLLRKKVTDLVMSFQSLSGENYGSAVKNAVWKLLSAKTAATERVNL